MIKRALLMFVILSLICGTMVSARPLPLFINDPIFNINNILQQDQNQQQQQDQSQQQQQEQHQEQDQQQQQKQSNYQNVVIILPDPEPEIKTLYVGEVEFTRLLGRNEVVTYPLHGISIITVKAAYPLAVYTMDSRGDVFKINSKDSTPVYDWTYHKFQFGSVSPVDQIPYYTTKGSLVSSSGADYAVIDNRNPFSEYNLVEVSIGRM